MPSMNASSPSAAHTARGSPSRLWSSLVVLLLLWTSRAAAVFISFDDCVVPATSNVSGLSVLQFVPHFVNAVFDSKHPTHSLNLTVYGNVTGQQYTAPLPPPDSPDWTNATDLNGKITRTGVGTNSNYTTLTEDFAVLSYSAFHNASIFCDALINGECPLAPVFSVNSSNADPQDLPAFLISHNFGSSYAFSTISTTIHVISGNISYGDLLCVSAQLTPDLGRTISNILTWIPAAILILKGLATISAAVWSPWGSADIFRWSSNYGRDEDLLRLVTPGFGDCLQYIQFIVLTGALTLNYPGFFQPAVSQASWSLLLFNESYVSHGPGTQSLVDGLYQVNGTYGMAQMSQMIGMTLPIDIWACMAIWLLVIAGIVVLLCQLGFAFRWLYRMVTYTSEEDLRKKNLPFTLGNMIRLLFNFFILPIVALSLFQLVLAPSSPASVLACAACLLALMIISAGWILHVIFTTKPRTLLFDDMPTVLLYGPLYNTYDDSAAPFALIPVFITFMRGVALGAVQPSGIAQIILLAICEVILILTLNGFRPFQGQTSMNLYHTTFAIVRLTTVLLMISFVPSLGVTEAPRGWIGYVILLLHACVLVFGFFLNSMQTLIEVLLRSFGAGGDSHSGAIRGSILNLRMLKKRQNRPDTGDRASMMSSAAILQNAATDGRITARSRSISASSQQLLGRHSGFDNFSTGGDPLGSPDPEGESAATYSLMAGGRPSLTSRDTGDNYYRAPRQRKATLDAMSNPGIRTRANDVPYRGAPGQGPHERVVSYDSNAHDSPAPAFFRERQGSGGETAGPRTDYAVREVDQYYRGPALNDQPTRKLKTGPADPEGPAIVAQSWFQKMLFGVTGKKKDTSKGFEVVRSSRMPPNMMREEEGLAGVEAVEMQDTTPGSRQEPYFDEVPPSSSQKKSIDEAEGKRSRSVDEETIGEHQKQKQTQSFEFDFADGAPRRSDTVGRLRPDSETVGASGVLVPTVTTTLPTAYERRGSRATEDESNYDHPSEMFPSEEATPDFRLTEPAADLVDLPAHPAAMDTSRGYPPVPAQGGGYASNINGTGSGGNSNSNRQEMQVPLADNNNRLSAAGSDIARSAPAQDWLRAVDALTWPNEPAPPPAPAPASPPSQQPLVSFSNPGSPPIPQRDHRRTLSREVPLTLPSSGVPTRNPSAVTSRSFLADAQAAALYTSQYTQHQPPVPIISRGAFLNDESDDEDDMHHRTRNGDYDEEDDDEDDAGSGWHPGHRPSNSASSYTVSHHTAESSIHRNSLGANAALRASTAEYVGRPGLVTHRSSSGLARFDTAEGNGNGGERG